MEDPHIIARRIVRQAEAALATVQVSWQIDGRVVEGTPTFCSFTIDTINGQDLR